MGNKLWAMAFSLNSSSTVKDAKSLFYLKSMSDKSVGSLIVDLPDSWT